MARNRKIRFFFEYILYRLLSAVVRLLPRRWSLAFGGSLGKLCCVLFSKRRILAEDNMRRALPELSQQQIRANVQDMFVHLGIVSMDLLNLKQMHDEADLSTYFDIDGLDNLKKPFEEGKGVLLVTAHLGFWEAGTIFLPKLGFPTSFIAKRMKNPRMDDFLMHTREISGGEIIDARRGARRIVKALREGRVVCVLPDQDNRDGEVIDFFGRPARTTTMVAQLALKTGAAIVPGFTLRTPENRYYNWIEESLSMASFSGPDAVNDITFEINRRIEAAIRRQPSQWFWLHNRWRVD